MQEKALKKKYRNRKNVRQKRKTAEINLTISIITLNVNG